MSFDLLRFGQFSLPSTPDEEDSLVERIMWKLGIDVELYPQHNTIFWQRLENLLKTARTYAQYNESDREQIRGSAVNFFVSLEEVLDHSLSFATWALLSDHYGETRFACDYDAARATMASRLSGRKNSAGNKMVFDPQGRNTLYPLIGGFALLAHLCREILTTADDWKRPDEEFPGYSGETPLQLFPFRHKALLLDLRETDRARIIQLLEEITSSLEMADVANVRNRIEHRRPDFPSQEEIEGACGTLAEVMNKMEHSGVTPLVYLYAGRSVDRYARTVIALRDYKGREILISRPTEYQACRLPSLYEPCILVPWMRLGDSPDTVRFRYEEQSDYREMWHGYPLRRVRDIPAPEGSTTPDTVAIVDVEHHPAPSLED